MAKASCTCCPLRRPRFSVSTKTPFALRFLALQIRLLRPDITTYTVVRARCRVCRRRSIRPVPSVIRFWDPHYAHCDVFSEEPTLKAGCYVQTWRSRGREKENALALQ